MAGRRVRTRGGCWWCQWCVVLTALMLHTGWTTANSASNFEAFETEDSTGFQAVLRRRERSLNESEISRTGRQLGWQNLILGPCITSQGTLGRCSSFRNCYPYFKMPSLTLFDSWAYGAYDTCSYFTESGMQAFGVCCSESDQVRPSALPPAAGPSREEYPFPSNPAIPPNWPPPIPTHPPDHTIPPLPTHPPSPGYPYPPAQPTLPPRPATTQSTRPPTRPTTAATPQWPPPLPTHPPTARPPWATPPTTSQRPTTVRPPWATQPTTTVFPPWATQPTTTTTVRPPWATPPTTSRPTLPPAPQPDNEIVDNSCGAKNGYQDQERIVGGQNADVGEWPWIAALFNNGRQFCGGSLVDNEHILTAAHCVAHMSSWDVAKMTVRLGDHNIRSNTETRHIEKKVKRVVRHKGFDPRTLYNDVAVLTLDSPVTFSKNIRPICLPSGSSTYSGQPATVIGWGSLRESGAQPAVLQEVSIPIWTNQDCRQKYGHAAPGGIIETFLCAGQPSRDSCSGDSGGPLMVNQGRWTQVGIVSWGIGCGKGQYPGVYTRVTSFLPWITKNLKS